MALGLGDVPDLVLKELKKVRDEPALWLATFALAAAISTFLVYKVFEVVIQNKDTSISAKDANIQVLRDRLDGSSKDITQLRADQVDLKKERNDALDKVAALQARIAQNVSSDASNSKDNPTDISSVKAQLAQRESDLASLQARSNTLQQRVDATQEKIDRIEAATKDSTEHPNPEPASSGMFVSQAVGEKRWIIVGQGTCTSASWSWILPGAQVGDIMTFKSPSGVYTREQVTSSGTNQFSTIDISNPAPRKWRYVFLNPDQVHVSGNGDFTLQRCA